ncbi:DUF2336 domain-containing protein [Sphingomonas sabuli]|uniref:DUF2336 domain-containing protein n=1 Tax=Sphingomonas sabuli TaxID=2764186 RepID=A0A7G9L2V9_9SPHN|nr:DUF2336 domain-containing protein [Sphingomonas sabuli]QNM82958.1 DUF2336 domain-containing protein [Sphingomonas sabuli]
MACARADFFLDRNQRLSEQERSLMMAMLGDLVAMLADEFALQLAAAEPANDHRDGLFDRLWASNLLDIPDLVRLLLRRAEEERLCAAIRTGRPGGRSRFLQSLVSDDDGDISAAAMALILAASRRRDRFDGPRAAFDDVPAEAAVPLVSAIAAALRPEVAARLGDGEADERLSSAARALLARHDEGNRLEARTFDLVHALEKAAALDANFLRSALADGEVALLVEALARRAGIAFDSAWDHFTGGAGQLALLLRMSGIERALAAELVATLAHLVGSDAESEIAAFDSLTDAAVSSARNWLRLDPAYRAAVTDLGHGNG